MSTNNPYDNPLYIDVVQEEASADNPEYYAGTRGFITGTTSGVLRGLADAASTTAAGLEQIGIETPVREGVKYAQKNWDIFKPDIPEAFGMEEGAYGTLKRLPQQLTSSVAGTAGGAIVGGLASGGNPVGAAIGATGAMALQFGLGTKKEKTEEYLAKNPGDFQGAEDYSNVYAASELGFEMASNAFAAVTFGGSKFLTSLAKSGAKSTAREMLQFSAAQLGKDTLKTGGVEMASELATYGAESVADVSYGMGDGLSAEGFRDTAITTAGMSLVFAAVGAKYQHGQRKQLRGMLENGTEAEQTAASSLIFKELSKDGDTDLATAWDSYSSSRIDRGLPINLDDKFVELGNKVAQEKMMPGDLLSSDPEIQKNAVDQILKSYGIGEDGGPAQGPETFEESLAEFLPPTQESVDEQQWKEDEAKAAADVYYKGEPKRVLGDIFTGSTKEELSSIARQPGIVDTPRQPSMTEDQIALQEQETEAKKFEVESLRWRQEQNLPKRTIVQELAQETDEQKRAKRSAEINKLIDQAMPLSPDTNDIVRIAKEQDITEDEARAIVHTNLSNYRKKIADQMSSSDIQEMEDLKKSTNTIIRTMMQEVLPDTNDLAPVIQKAEEVASASVKGSRQQKEAKAVVKAAKKIQAAKVVVDKVSAKQDKVVDAIVSTPAPEPIATPASLPTVQPRASQTPSRGDTYTVEDTAKPDTITVGSIDNTKGVEVAQLDTPETELMRREAEAATLSERQQMEDEIEVAESEIPELNVVANEANDPILTAVLNQNEASLMESLEGRVTNSEKQAAVLSAIRKLGEEATRKYKDQVVPLIQWAVETVNIPLLKNKKGAKLTDAISWPSNKTGAKSTTEVGKHKESGQEVTIEKDSSNIPGKRTAMWSVVVDGEVKDKVEGKVAARQAAEKYVTPLSPEKIAAIKKASTTRSGKALSLEEKRLNARFNEANRINKERTETKEEEVSSVVVIDPKTGKKKVVPYVAPKEEVKAKLTKADATAKTKTRASEIEAEMEKEEDPDVDLSNYDQIAEEEGMVDEAKGLDISTKLSKLLDANKWNAEKVLEAEKDNLNQKDESTLRTLIEKKKARKESTASELEKIFSNGESALRYIVNNGTKVEAAIAKLILANTSKKKLNSIIFKVDPDPLKPGSYSNGVVTVRSNDTEVAIHEFVHAVTVQEMKVNPELKTRVESLMSKVKRHALDTGKLTEYQLDFIRKNSTSQLYKKNREGVIFDDIHHIAYALINTNEFLAQALTDRKFQEFLKEIKLDNPKSFLKTLWDSIVKIVGDALGLSNMHHNMLSEVLMVSVELMKQKERSLSSGGRAEFLTGTADKMADWFESQSNKYARQKTATETAGETVTKGLKSTEKWISNTFQGIDNALKHISPSIANAVERMDFLELKTLKERTDLTIPFVKDLSDMRSRDRKRADLYLNNLGVDPIAKVRLKELLKNPEHFDNVLKMIDEVREQQELFGIAVYDTIEDYFPRVIKDYDGLVSYLRKQEDWGMMDEALREGEAAWAKDHPGTPITDKERGHILGSLIRTGRAPGFYLKNPTSSKQRSIKRVNADMMEFYYTPTEALGIFIRENTSAIEINRMLGITGRKKIIKDIDRQYKKVEAMMRDKKISDDTKNAASKELADLQAKLIPMDQEIEGSIGDLLAKGIGRTTVVKEVVNGKKVTRYVHDKGREITADDQRRAKDLIRARITEKGLHGMVKNIRQLALVSSLTQVGTGLIQLSDNTWSMYRSGALNTLKAIINVATDQHVVKENFINFEDSLREFSTPSKIVDGILKWSGLSLMDRFGKKVSMEATLLSVKEKSREEFITEWDDKLKDAGDVYDKISRDDIGEEAQFMLASRIAEFQPIYKSSMSKTQATAGNWRILYFLKSFAIRASNNFYEESIRKMREGDVKGGLKSLAHLGTLFVLLGASTDWLRDWLVGKSPDLTDSMIDTIMTLGLISRYTVERGTKDGIAKSILTNILPPTGLLDMPYRDLMGVIDGNPTMMSLKLIPGLGQISYGWLTDEGAKKTINNTRSAIIKEAVDGSTPSDEISNLNSDIRRYNIGKKKSEKIAPITPGTISEARKRKREKDAR